MLTLKNPEFPNAPQVEPNIPFCKLMGTLISPLQLEKNPITRLSSRGGPTHLLERNLKFPVAFEMTPRPQIQLKRFPKTPTTTQEDPQESTSVRKEPYYASQGGALGNKDRGSPPPELVKTFSPQLERSTQGTATKKKTLCCK